MTIEPKLRGGGRCYKIKKISAFTLVELIIVITILVVLATIGFLNFGNYGSQARDTVRTVDFKAIQKALELYKIENGEYPDPDNPVEIENTSLNKEKYKGFIEGKIGTELAGKLKFGEVPKDPQTKEEYGYMVTEDRKNYMLKITKEDGGELSVGGIPTSCEKIKELGLFKGNGLYPIFFKERGPIDVYCHKDFNRDFYQFVLGGDMEKDEKAFTMNSSSIFSDEENSTPNGNKSLKFFGGRNYYTTNHFTYVDPTKNYKLSGKIKVYRNGGLGYSDLSFISFDDKFRRIEPGFVRVLVEGTETIVSRRTNSGDKTIYFNCNNNLYNKLKSNLNHFVVIAYDVDDSGEYKDLPNRKISGTIGNEVIPENSNPENIRNNFLKKVSSTECSLRTVSHFLPADVGTKIRFHYHTNWGSFAQKTGPLKVGEWMEYNLSVNGQSKYLTRDGNGTFRPGTKFIKIELGTNLWFRWEGDIFKTSDDTSVTYFDDIKMEVTN